MFVKKLSKKQVDDFIRESLMEDFHPEVPRKKQVELQFYEGEEIREVHYCSKTFNKHISVYLMDDRMVPLISKKMENAWIRHLYSIFGEEYKKWYLSEKAKIFD